MNDDDPNRVRASSSVPLSGQVIEQQQQQAPITSYLVASSPEVLAQLMKESEERGTKLNPALYTTPASALNIATVDFAPSSTSHPPPSPAANGRLSRPRHQSSTPSSLERTISLPGSAHSTLSRGGSPAHGEATGTGSLEKCQPGRGSLGPLGRRKASFVATFNSASQVTRQPHCLTRAYFRLELTSCTTRVALN